MLDRRRSPRPGLLTRFADGLDGLLSNFVGSAQIGPYVAPDPDQVYADIACPTCGRLISAHRTEHTAQISRLYCPPIASSTTSGTGPDASRRAT